MSIAFFDLDKTLIAENSAKLWLKALWQEREIKLLPMLRASYWLAKYHMGFTRFDEIIEKTLRLIEGQSHERMRLHIGQFYDSTVKPLYRPGALRAIDEHRAQGHKISLLTSSFDELALLVQAELKLDYCLCTRLEVDRFGFYTGNTIGPPCFGKNKIIFAEQLCEQLNIALDQTIFYTDSASDLALLKKVGRAVAVNPDPHLRARAQLYRWDIVDWGVPWAKEQKQ